MFNFVRLNNEFARLLSIKLKVNSERKVQWWKLCNGKYSQFITVVVQSDIPWEHFPGDLDDKLAV